MRVFDVLIVGGGLVGASLAAALAAQPLRIGLLEAAPPSADAPTERADWDSRIYAISPANRDFLDRLGAWSLLDRERMAPVRMMHVRGDASDSLLEFSSYDTGTEALAWILESSALARALWTRVRASPNVEQLSAIRPAEYGSLDIELDRAVIRLDDGSALAASLVVGADGASSWVREQAGITVTVRDYQQIGVVANFRAERAHGGIARQWFFATGEVLALLPLPGRLVSMVWSATSAHAETLLALQPASLALRVAEAAEGALGRLEMITAPQGFPLRDITTSALVADRIALVGDAAHVVHPLAGQGVNLGFGDADYLASLLATREHFRSCGDTRLLARYQRGRAEDILAIRSVTRGLHGLFALPGGIPSRIRNAGLNLTNRLPVIKTMLTRRALG